MDIRDRLHNLMTRSGWQSREDQETIFAGVKEIDRLRAELAHHQERAKLESDWL